MGWVALQASGIVYTATLGTGNTLASSVLTCAAAVPSAKIVFEAPQNLRITSQSRNFAGVGAAPTDSWSWNNGADTQANTDTTGATWAPSPFLVHVEEGMDLSYVLGSDTTTNRSFGFLIEVDTSPVINCDCDDEAGGRTLAQLRDDLYTALGFVDPLGHVVTRSLKDLRDDVVRRAGNAAIAGGTLPPGMSDLIDGILNESQQTLFRRLELDSGDNRVPARMVGDGMVTTLDYVPVLNLAIGTYKAHLGAADAKLYFEMTEKYLKDTLERNPPNSKALCTKFLQDAQRQLIVRYRANAMDRWFTWNLVKGVRFYDLPDNLEKSATTPCAKTIDQFALRFVGIQNGSLITPLRKGIPNVLVGSTATAGWPTYYDIKQCIEIWPAPSSTQGQLRIRAGFKLLPFADDGDTTSVDEELVFLFALANAKAHYKQADAQNVAVQFSTHLKALVARSHGTRRYIPGRDRDADMVYTEPKPTVPFT